jgi:hypothetical protein
VGHLPILRAFVDSDTPMIDPIADNPFFTEIRARMSFGELVAVCEMKLKIGEETAAAAPPLFIIFQNTEIF